MYNLSFADLVDHNRSSVIVVITKSLAVWDELDDFKSDKEKNEEWKCRAEDRRKIVDELRQKVFPDSSPWETVFIENGGGSDMRAKFPTLPDSQQSHQNLCDAIRSIVDPDGGHKSPRGGIQALQVFTGTKHFRHVDTQVLFMPNQKNPM
jgi:hypothetical protein